MALGLRGWVLIPVHSAIVTAVSLLAGAGHPRHAAIPVLLPAGAAAEVRGGAVDEVAGDVGEPLVAGAGVVAEQPEGPVHVKVQTLGELALGLLDDDPAGQGGLELLGGDVAAPHVALLQEADRGDVG
jgi:hypothetical protein